MPISPPRRQSIRTLAISVGKASGPRIYTFLLTVSDNGNAARDKSRNGDWGWELAAFHRLLAISSSSSCHAEHPSRFLLDYLPAVTE